MTATQTKPQTAHRQLMASTQPRQMTRPLVLTVSLLGALLLGVVISAGTGAYHIPSGDVIASILHRLGVGGAPVESYGEDVLWNIRFPRVALACIVGACLAVGGTLMQGMFGNPLAEPGIIGVSTGASVGAVAAIALGLTFAGSWTIGLCAFITGLTTVIIVYAMSRSGGRTEVVTLILTGVAINAFAGATIGLLIFISDESQITSITFWQMGSLSQATWPKVAAIVPLAGLGLIIAPLYARKLDLLSLGERSARHLGVNVEQMRLVLITVIALLTAAAVAVSGVIGFIGLVVPHLLRMIIGPGHRLLIPLSILGGAAVLVWADLAARTIAAPAELPLGVLTALVGSPFFFWLLRRTRRRQGGWA